MWICSPFACWTSSAAMFFETWYACYRPFECLCQSFFFCRDHHVLKFDTDWSVHLATREAHKSPVGQFWLPHVFHSDSLWISFSLSPDLRLGSGITVPARSILVVPLHLVQMDASVWGDDADQFNPHRFLKKDVDIGGLLSLPLLFTLFCVGRYFIYDMKKYYWMYKQAVCNSILKIISITSLLSVCI